MNHDYAHCADYTDKCPKKCFRGELVRDLFNRPYLYVSWMNLKGTDECMLKEQNNDKERSD